MRQGLSADGQPSRRSPTSTRCSTSPDRFVRYCRPDGAAAHAARASGRRRVLAETNPLGGDRGTRRAGRAPRPHRRRHRAGPRTASSRCSRSRHSRSTTAAGAPRASSSRRSKQERDAARCRSRCTRALIGQFPSKDERLNRAARQRRSRWAGQPEAIGEDPRGDAEATTPTSSCSSTTSTRCGR